MDLKLEHKEVKVVLLGASGVGKSSILTRYCFNQFKTSSDSTLGAAFKSQNMMIKDRNFRFQIWDTAGQERYKSLTPLYYRDAQVALIVYDISNKESFETLRNWVDELKVYGPKNIIQVLVGNKSDLIDQEQVPYPLAVEYAKSIGSFLRLTSCKDAGGVKELFQNIGEMLLEDEQKAMEQIQKAPYKSVLVPAKPQKNKDQKGCC